MYFLILTVMATGSGTSTPAVTQAGPFRTVATCQSAGEQWVAQNQKLPNFQYASYICAKR